MQPSISSYTVPFNAKPDARAELNRANAKHSTGPRTPEGKTRSAQNALTHGLTSKTTVLPHEDIAAYQLHVQQLQNEYHPKNATEIQLVQELADTSWRLNRIPFLEAGLLADTSLPTIQQVGALSSLGLHGHRLSRQFQKILELLRDMQADRKQTEQRELTRAAGIMEHHKHKGIPYDPAIDGFVFSRAEIETHAERLVRTNDARNTEYFRFFMKPEAQTLCGSAGYH